MGNQSYLIDSQVTEVSYAEPVTLAETKTYLRVSHPSEDAQIATMISAARRIIEDAAGLSIIQKSVKIWFSNMGGWFQLPFGPIVSSVTLYDETTNTILTDTTIIGGNHKIVKFPKIDSLRAEYLVGYSYVPVGLKYAILDQVNHMYENRGAFQDHTGICEKSWRACQQFKRVSPIL